MYSSQDSSFIKMVIHPSPTEVAENWHMSEEGQLSVDVFETEDDVVIMSTLAGADVENIEISLQNDLLTIHGNRPQPFVGTQVHWFHKECFWGKFSRTIVLPRDVKEELAHAQYKNGVLCITIPKQKQNTRIPVVIVDE